jgi:hypothetical protein
VKNRTVPFFAFFLHFFSVGITINLLMQQRKGGETVKRITFAICVFALAFYLTGCGKKQQTLEQMQEPVSMEVLSMLNNTNAQPVAAATQAAPEVKPQAVPQVQTGAPKLEPLPPSGPYKPSVQDIQTALKNAGFYNGNVDGKLGPASKKAVAEFQKANNLTADGKVGPKTWAALSKYLTQQAPVNSTVSQ